MTTPTSTQEHINRLIEFRQAVYHHVLAKCRDALFDIVDALLAGGTFASFAYLSQNERFQRKWPSLYVAVEDGQVDVQALCDLLVSFCLVGAACESAWSPVCAPIGSFTAPPNPRRANVDVPPSMASASPAKEEQSWGKPDEVQELQDERYGKVRLKRWNGLRDKRALDLTCDLLRAEAHLEKHKPPAPVWFAWLPPVNPPADIAITAQTIWTAYVHRWPIEPGIRFRKETLGWTLPRFQSAETLERPLSLPNRAENRRGGPKASAERPKSGTKWSQRAFLMPKPLEIRLVKCCPHPDTSVRGKMVCLNSSKRIQQ